MSQGPPACKAALQDVQCSAALLAAAQAVTALPPTAARATEPVLRNVWWTLLSLCDRTPAQHATSISSNTRAVDSRQMRRTSSSSFQQELLLQFQETGAVQMLRRLLCLQHGLSAGWVAAAQLGLLVQLGHEEQQLQQQEQQQQQAEPRGKSKVAVDSPACALAASAVQAVLQEDSTAGLCQLMLQLQLEQQQPAQEQQQQQLSGRMRVLVEGLLHYVLTFNGPQLLQVLIELQLLGCFATHCCTRLGRLLVCQLLSSRGQEVMAAVEEGYELDVALALAQIIPLKLHFRLPQPPPQQQPTNTSGEIEAMSDGAGAAGAHQQEQQQEQQAQAQPAAPVLSDDLYTDILACRLLLQHQRLWEVLSAACEELQQPLPEQQQQNQQDQQQLLQATSSSSATTTASAGQAEREGGVVPTTLQLIHHLMSRDLQLQAARHVRGDCVSDSLSSSANSSGSSRNLEEALAMPDHTGTYSKVLEGMVPPEQLPSAAAAAAGASSSKAVTRAAGETAPVLTLPDLPSSSSSQTAAAAGSSHQVVVFRFGHDLEHAVDAAMFKKIKHCSKLVHSILARVRPSSSSPAADGAGTSSSSGGACAQSQAPEPVTVLCIPQFTPEANCWVLKCLERWLGTKALAGFSVLQAAKLWVAADFLQVDDLQKACEDLIAAGFKQDTQHMHVALELCARHTESGGRLLRLLVQEVLRQISSACGGSSTSSSGELRPAAAVSSVQQQGNPRAVMLLQQLLASHTALLLPVIHAELRDRLVALCMLNAGLDAEDPLDAVE